MKTNYKFFALVVLFIAGGCSSPTTDSKSAENPEKERVAVSAPTDGENTREEEKAQVNLKDLKIPIPKKYELLDSICGDLDQDNVSELVVAYNTSLKTEDEGIKRSLCIYKIKNDHWELWKESKSALLGSKQGGMMGDPFNEMKIKNGILAISHYGGSSWKWGYTDKYRFQNSNFELIGYQSLNGKACEYWETEDFNLSTGKFIYSKEYETCSDDEEVGPNTSDEDKEKETFYKKGIRLTLSNRHDKEISFKTPKGEEIYL